MKRHLIYNIFLLLILQNSLLANQSQQDYEQMECALASVDHITQNASSYAYEVFNSLCIFRSNRNLAGSISSENWAGYVAADDIDNPTSGSVTAVYASWIVPKNILTDSSPDTTGSSVWIGIDGVLPSSNALVQTGTASQFLAGSVFNYAFYQVIPNPISIIPNLFAVPGDVMSASVVYQGGDIFTISITNVTRNQFFTINVSSPQSVRNVAEWIVEAPEVNGQVSPLGDFAVVHMWDCRATINGITGPINDPSWQNTTICMETTGKTKAIPSVLFQDKTFFVTWKSQ
jgi:hypothetical protein